TELAYSEDAAKRYEAYGWYVQTIDGHDRAQIRGALDRAVTENRGRPSFIRARTHIANGAPHAHDTAEAHGSPLGKHETAATKKAMGWDPTKSFVVPDAVYGLFKERAGDLAKERAAQDARVAAWRKANPELAKQEEAFSNKTIPANIYDELLSA